MKLVKYSRFIVISIVSLFFMASIILPFTIADARESTYTNDPTLSNDSMPRDMDQKVCSLSSSRYSDVTAEKISQIYPSKLSLDAESDYVVGEKASYWVGWWGKWYYNETDWSGYMTFTLRGESSTLEIWVADDLTFFSGDPRNSDPGLISITDSQISYMLKEWEQKIYPEMTNLIGYPNERDGRNSDAEFYEEPYLFPTDTPEKIMLMVFNIADDSFFDPSLEYFGQGYFDPNMADYYNRNIIHMSSYDWQDRLAQKEGKFAFQYEYILSHEFEHLINSAHNPWQDPFLDEGCAELCPILIGYGLNNGQLSKIRDFLATPDNSLTIWNDQWATQNAADYGGALLFVLYLLDHFGYQILKPLVDTTEHGIEAVNMALKSIDQGNWDFDKVFKCWRLANLIHSDQPGNGLYNYRSIDLSALDLGELTTQEYSPSATPWFGSASEAFGTTISRSGYDTGVSALGPYSTDYIWIQGEGSWASELDKRKLKLLFDGEDVTQGWQRYASGVLPTGWATESKTDLSSPWTVQYQDVRSNEYFMEVQTVMEKPDEWPPPISDEWLFMTERFSTEGYDNASLNLEYQFYTGNPESTCDVMISTDGGTNFVTVYTFDTSAWEWTPVAIDLDGFMGQADVRLAFRLYDVSWTSDGCDLKIDNIAIVNYTGTNIFSENFNNYVVDCWWSDTGDMADYSLVGMANLKRSTTATLEIDTKWRMWWPEDFGFIQISTDKGATWTSLSNDYTWTDEDVPGIMPEVLENAPYISGGWNYHKGWITLSFDISQYAGQSILYRFRYLSDPSYNMDGWFIKDVRINGMSVDPLTLRPDPPHPKDDWMVTIYYPECRGASGRLLPAKIIDIDPSEGFEMAMLRLSRYTMYTEMYIIVSNTYGTNDYGFGIGTSSKHP